MTPTLDVAFPDVNYTMPMYFLVDTPPHPCMFGVNNQPDGANEMSSLILTRKCSPTFPVQMDESWVVRGYGGEPSERWTVVSLMRGKTFTQFSALVEELHT